MTTNEARNRWQQGADECSFGWGLDLLGWATVLVASIGYFVMTGG